MLVKCFLYVTGNHDRPFMGGEGAFTRTYFAAYKLGIKENDAFNITCGVTSEPETSISIIFNMALVKETSSFGQ